MDPRSLSLTRCPVKPDSGKAPHHGSGELFLRGPIPWDWLCTAAIASGQGSGFKLAIVLWHLSGLNRQSKTVKLSGKKLREMGVDRHAAYRSLKSLEAANLISVERRLGRSPVVTIIGVVESD
jgi:hypothetical protein